MVDTIITLDNINSLPKYDYYDYESYENESVHHHHHHASFKIRTPESVQKKLNLHHYIKDDEESKNSEASPRKNQPLYGSKGHDVNLDEHVKVRVLSASDLPVDLDTGIMMKDINKRHFEL